MLRERDGRLAVDSSEPVVVVLVRACRAHVVRKPRGVSVVLIDLDCEPPIVRTLEAAGDGEVG